MVRIDKIKAREILDSRGNPTLETEVLLEDGAVGIASVPSGASRGKYEAIERRDNNPKRYQGMGVLQAVRNVNQLILPKLRGKDAYQQAEIDRRLKEIDGTDNKSNLGANAILSVSQGVCEATAASKKMANYEYIAQIYGLPKKDLKMPIPTFNLINGGKHGKSTLDFQEFHLIPGSNFSFSKSLQIGEAVYHELRIILERHQANYSVGDEGGFAPELLNNLDAFRLLVEAISNLKYVLNKNVFLGLDAAAGTFYQDNKYFLRDKSLPLSNNELIGFYRSLSPQFPLLFLEDPFYEDDWLGWSFLSRVLKQTIIVGDDLLATNKRRVSQAIKKKACSGILIKPNQIGTISETIEVIKIAKNAGWKIFVSHRSGETNDDFIADFAVGVGADYTKFGAPARGERIAKYNRLLQIEKEL